MGANITLQRRANAWFTGFRDRVATIGIANTCLYATSRLLGVLFKGRIRIVKYYFMAQAVSAQATETSKRRGAFTFEFVGPESPVFRGVDRPATVIAARFAQGARCLAATDREAQFAGFLWFVIGSYEEDEVRARFDPGPAGQAAWDFDVSIVPRYRMGRLFGYLWERASAELAMHGVRHSLSRISAFNGPSLASHRRLGARILGQALFVCIGRVQLMKSTVAPKWHFSWHEERRPVLAIMA
jgi:hypothetical protein